MCGLVGVISKSPSGLFKTHADLFKQLLWADQLRGTDGTGLFYNQKDEKTFMLKSPTPASGLFAHKKFEDCIDKAVKDGNFLIGHNRAATKGKKVWEDTHPFIEKHICLVHNGTLHTHKNLADTSVDSHAIAKYMAEHGTEETIPKIDGAFALIWADMEKRTLNLCRNYQRPLFLIDADTVWIVCSEAELGEWIATRNNFKVISKTSLLPGKLYYFDMTKNYKEYHTQELKLYTYSTPATKSHHHPYSHQNDDDYFAIQAKSKKEFVPGKNWYSVGDKVQFVLVPEKDTDTTVIRKHPKWGYDIIIGKITQNATKHDIIVTASREMLAEYDKKATKIWEATIASATVQDNVGVYYIKNMLEVTIEKKQESNVVQLPIPKHPTTNDDVSCCTCGSIIWKGKDKEEAMDCGNNMFICKTCQDDWKEDLPSLVAGVKDQSLTCH